MDVLELRGSPREVGVQHGESLRAKIQEMLGGWQYAIEKSTRRTLADWALDFRDNTGFAAATQRWTPALAEELDGLAAGADIDPDVLFLFNCTDENDWFMAARGAGLDLPEGRGCSSLALAGRAANPVIAQNMDIPGATDGYQTLLRIRYAGSDTEALIFSIAGLLGMIGLNNHGVGLVNNSLRQLRQRVDGLPVTMVVRGLLATRSFIEADDFIRGIDHATGHNYILGDAGAVGMYECSAAGAVPVDAEADGVWLHTNHALVSADASEHAVYRTRASASNTGERLRSMRQRLPFVGDPVALARDVLSAHDDPENPVCRHVTNKATNFSAGAVIYELSGTPTLHIAPGPPCSTPFATYGFGA